VHVQVYIYESALYAERSVQSIAHKAIIDSLIDDEDHQRDEDPAYEPQIVRVSLVANELSVQLDAS
jgi:23S rRNA G2445 N2-methylase RlmL